MGRELRLEYLLRKVLGCDRFHQRLLTFGGIANSDLLRSEGGFYNGAISALARLYPVATLMQCDEIDMFVSDLDDYRNIKINDIPESEYNAIYERINILVNTIMAQ